MNITKNVLPEWCKSERKFPAMTATNQQMSSIGKRKPYTIYVDKRVWRQFKPLAQKMFKDVSRALEAYMMSEVLKQKKKKWDRKDVARGIEGFSMEKFKVNLAIRCGQPEPDEYGKTGSNEASVNTPTFPQNL